MTSSAINRATEGWLRYAIGLVVMVLVWAFTVFVYQPSFLQIVAAFLVGAAIFAATGLLFGRTETGQTTRTVRLFSLATFSLTVILLTLSASGIVFPDLLDMEAYRQRGWIILALQATGIFYFGERTFYYFLLRNSGS